MGQSYLKSINNSVFIDQPEPNNFFPPTQVTFFEDNIL